MRILKTTSDGAGRASLKLLYIKYINIYKRSSVLGSLTLTPFEFWRPSVDVLPKRRMTSKVQIPKAGKKDSIMHNAKVGLGL